MTKRLAKIYMPDYDNAGIALNHDGLKQLLLGTFGGFTMYPAVGAWQNGKDTYMEQVVVYEIAVDHTPINTQKIRDIASMFGRGFGQLAVSVLLPDGEFEIIDLEG